MSIEPFNKLVKLAARAFYDDFTTKTGSSVDNRGIAVVVLEALSRRQWVREEDLANDLKLSRGQLRRTLRFFEEEKLINRDHRKETAKYAKEGEEKTKLHTHSYCCLDYAQIYDVVRYRLHRMKKKLKDELEDKNKIQEYVCANMYCGKRFNALDALQLLSMEDDYFHCVSCNGILVAESDKIANSQEIGGDGDSKARRKKLKDILQSMEEQLKPLMEQISRVKDLPVPEFGTLQAWELVRARRAGNGESSALDLSRSSQGMMGWDTKVQVDISGVEIGNGDDIKSEADTANLKVYPPWMIKQGMNLTKEQPEEAKMDATVAAPEFSDDKRANTQDNEKYLLNEYLKSYYAALQQRNQEAAAKKQLERQVGMKSKFVPEEEEDENVDWEEAEANGNYKEDEDDIDWEEG